MNRNDILVACRADAARRRFLVNTGWTNEARAASLAVRQDKARARAEEEAKLNAEMDAADQAADEEHYAGLKDGTVVKRRGAGGSGKESQRDLMFQEQRQIAGKDFHGNWYPAGDDGGLSNPFVGKVGRGAEFGYHEITGKPRREPIYSAIGKPVIPRTREEWNAKDSDLSLWQRLRTPAGQLPSEKLAAYQAQVEKLALEYGPFGKRREWMKSHPGASYSDWLQADEAEYQAKKELSRRWKAASRMRGKKRGQKSVVPVSEGDE